MGSLIHTEGQRRWFILQLNPEPWAVGPVTPGRRGGKIFATIGRNQQLAAFEEAVAEELGTHNYLIEGPVKLQFFFWRKRSVYKTQREEMHMKHHADVTNMQKALEDALQGVLFENDKETNDIHSIVVEQGPDTTPMIIFSIEPSSTPPMGLDIPGVVMMNAVQIKYKAEPTTSSAAQAWTGPEEF